MAINPNQQKTPNSPVAEDMGVTFGGTNPEFLPASEGTFSLENVSKEEYNVGPTFSLDGQTSAIPQKNGAIAAQRIAKVQFAFGSDAPDAAVMENQLATGREDLVRQQMVEKENAKDTDAKIAVVKQMTEKGLPKDPREQKLVQDVINHKPDNNPNTVFEKAFARAYINMVPSLGDPSTNPVSEGLKTNPEHTNMVMDIAQELAAKQETAKTAAENIKAEVANQSWSETVHDVVNRFMPGYDWYTTYNAVKGDYTSEILQGSNWAQQIDYLYSLPVDQMHVKLQEALNKIKEYNTRTAQEFAEAVVSFGSSDRFIHNVGNVVDVVTVIPVGSTLKILNKTASAISKGGTIRSTEEVAIQALKDALKANASETTSIADTLSKMGNITDSAVINASKKVDEIIGGAEAKAPTPEGIRRTLPSIFNPESIIADGANLSAVQTQAILQRLEANANKFMDRISNLSNVVTPEEAKVRAIKETADTLRDEYSHINKSIIDISYVPPELHPTMPNANVSSVTMRIGDRDGNPFTTQMQAYDFGRSWLKLHSEDIVVEQKGLNFYLIVNRNIDETLPSVRAAAVISTDNQAPVTIPNMLFGWLRSANDRVSQHQIEQRIAAVSGISALTEAMKPIAKEIGALSKKEHNRVGKVIDANRSYVNPNDGTFGRYHYTIPEFEKEFKYLNGVYPTEKEVSAYFSARQLADFDYMFRNEQYYKSLARSGMREYKLFDTWVHSGSGANIPTPGERFLAREVKELPIDDRNFNAGVLIHTGDEGNKYYRMSQLQTEEGRRLLKELTEERGFKIIQPYNTSRKFLNGKYTDENVHFILTKDPEVKNLRYDVLPYQEGFHKQYAQKYYVKQPQIEGRGNQNIGLGDLGEEINWDGEKTLNLQFMANRNGSQGKQQLGSQYSYRKLTEEDYDRYVKPTMQKELTYKEYLDEVSKKENLGYTPTHIKLRNNQIDDKHFVLDRVGTKDFFHRDINQERKNWRRSVDSFESPEAKYFAQIDDEDFAKGILPKNEPLYHDFVGDKTVFAFNTKPEAVKYAKLMDEARVIMNTTPEKLGAFLEKNLPFSESRFKSLFESRLVDGKVVPPEYSKDASFLHVFDKQTTFDAHGDALRQQYKGLQDQVRSPYNPIADIDKKFIGQKDADLWTVKESGTDHNPTFQLESAKMLDPWITINNAMANIMRNRFMADYKSQAVESWVEQFGHLIETQSKADLLNNSMYHVFQPQWKRTTIDNISEMAAAKNSRRAIMELIGNESPVQTIMGSIKQKLADLTYDKFGQRASDIVADKLLASETDPIRAMKGFAFHTTIGMFNPLQLWQNLNTMSFAVGLGGTKGLIGSATSPLMRYAMINSNPKVLAELGSIAEKISDGQFKSAWFQESFKEMQKTGRMFVEGEHAWRDDLADPKFIQGALGTFLDKGQFFFREGERATRLAGWNTAFLEWRMANPEAKITDQIRNKILARSDDMNANMTRASMASWQTGVLSVPAQFIMYPIRITEMMLRKSIPLEDRVRNVAVQSALYGLPIGVTGTTLGGFYDFYKDIREAGLRYNINMDDPTIDALHSGLEGLVGAYLTGRPSSLGDKAGPGGNSLLRDLLHGGNDKTIIDFAFGASGSKVASALTSMKPALGSLVSYATGSEQKVPPTINDFVDIARNISSVDNAVKTFLALNTGKLINKNGTYLGDVSPTEAVLAAFTGGQPRAISDVELMKNWGKTRENLLKEVQKEATKWHSMALAAGADNDRPNYEVYMTRLNTLLDMSDLRPNERAEITKKVWETNQSQAAKVAREFFIDKAPPSKASGAADVYKNYNPNPTGR